MCRACDKEMRKPTAHVCRWVCLCGNLIREDVQHPQLQPQTLRGIGECCAHVLPKHMKNRAMTIVDMDNPQPQANDQRKERRMK